MQIVINISDMDYDDTKKYGTILDECRDDIAKAIINGTPLPKGHGRLIDAEYLKDISLVHNFHANNKYFVPYKDRKGYRLRDREVREAIINASTIIEADKAESEG